MQVVTSYFLSERAMRESLFRDTPSGSRACEYVTFEVHEATRPGERLRLVLVVSGERTSLEVTLVGRRERGGVWEYLARVDEGDRIWLEMLLKKVKMKGRVFAAEAERGLLAVA
jgi:hypothetical protein